MKEILKELNSKEDLKTKEIFYLLKTNSQKVNSEISKKIKFFNKTDDFFNHYSNQMPIFEFLNKLEFNSSNNYDGVFSSFESNLEQYISYFVQIIISIKITLRAKEILNKIFLSLKQYLSNLKSKKQVENISKENLFLFIENLLNVSGTKIQGCYSNLSPMLNIDSSDSVYGNLLHHQNFINGQNFKPLSNIDFGKTLKILYEEPCTPKFGSKSDKNYEKENYNNIHLKKKSTITLSGEKEINSLEDKDDDVKDKINDFIQKKECNNYMKEKKYENLLEMINNIYKKCIINSEEKIKLKKLVISKYQKLENLYNTYKNKYINKNILRLEIKKLTK